MVLRQTLFNHFLTLPALFFDAHSSGNLISAITYNVEQVAEASSEALTTGIRETFTAVGLIVVMLTVSVPLTLWFLVSVPFVAIIMTKVSKRLRNVSARVQDAMGALTHVSQEAIEGYKEVRLFGGQQYETCRFRNASNHNRQQEMKIISTTAISTPIVQLLGAVALGATIYLAALLGRSEGGYAISPGGFTAMIVAMIALLKPVKQLTKMNTKIQKGLAGANSIFAFLDQKPELDTGTVEVAHMRGEIEFKNVSFRYAKDKPYVLKNINLSIPAHKTIAIVGRSGSGKTTLANLIARFYNAEGDIYIDGVEIKEFNLRNLRKHIALVSQNITLFNDTIYQNIIYGFENPPPVEKVHEAAKMANAFSFIEAQKEGFDAMIGDKGLKLSGGQRQRLAIARAILKDAPILILDEATSALDSESEKMIQDALETLMKGRTTLVIAHRLSTIERADLIVVMEAGEIIEKGTHQALLQKEGQYAEFWRLQRLAENK